MNNRQDRDLVPESADHQPAKGEVEREVWVKPEITDFKPVTVAQGISYRPGDGISNLS